MSGSRTEGEGAETVMPEKKVDTSQDQIAYEVYERVGVSRERANQLWREVFSMVEKNEREYEGLYTYEILGEVLDAYPEKNEQVLAVYVLGVIIGNFMAVSRLPK